MSIRAPVAKTASIGISTIAAALAICAAAPNAGAAAPVLVTISDKACVPDTISVPAGKTVFKIKNGGSRAVEWEILKGTAVIAERENILPGFEQTLTVTLDAGDYGMTCGRDSNPKGTLKVTK